MGVLLSGCAIHTPHLAIHRYPLAQQAVYYQEPLPYRVAVMPLVDQRVAQERQGQQPAGMFLLIWNRRVGDYYTGDRVFGEQVSRQLSQQLADYLQSAHVFAQTVTTGTLAHTPEAIQQVGRDQVADYVLGGELQHFFGSQHQQFSMFALPLYFINAFGWQDGKSLPWGQTTLLCTLSEARHGEMIWRHPIEQSWTMPRATDSMAEAAMKSFAATASQLATELHQLQLASVDSQ
jgi:hypothetical protein